MNDPDLLREQARAWIDARFDPGMSLRSWLELLADSGCAAPAWPAAWYGRDLPAALAAVAIAEFGAAGVPGPPAGLGPLLAAPTIIAHGTDELKRSYVRAVLTGEHAWCQLFSEPGAGSDLASLATRAERAAHGPAGRRGQAPAADDR
jgi:alkylation response protein AidB-like acyl-CoA dehydrogenase